MQQVGQHSAPVKDVASFIHPESGVCVIVTGGWDACVKFWRFNQASLQQVGEAFVGMPVHYMSCVYPLLVTAHQNRYIHVWSLDECLMSQRFDPKDLIVSQLKFATTSITVFGDGKGYAVGSIEGRCSIKNYDKSKENFGEKGDFCFKCHRNELQDPKGQAEVYSVNSIAFNKEYNTFATFGGDCTSVTWNKDTKARYRVSKKFPCPVTSGDFSEDGRLMAFAIGNDYSKGAEGVKQVQYLTKLILRAPIICAEVNKRK